MKATIDPIVWDYAKNNNLMIVSKDADMHDLSLVRRYDIEPVALLPKRFVSQPGKLKISF